MKLFASDLDRTLIYSRRAMGAAQEALPPLRLVETVDGREVSFMTERAVELLKQIAAEMCFVPVTTRTVEQYRRVFLFQEELAPHYAVASNGGRILIDGAVDAAWSRQIRLDLEQSSLALPEMVARFAELQDESWLRGGGIADELFYYCVVERDRLPMSEIDDFANMAAVNGWSLSIQGRKIYLVPSLLSKGRAVAYIRELTGAEAVVAAGDSLLDLPMLHLAELGIAPPHGEIGTLSDTGLLLTAASGILAAEELLGHVQVFNSQKILNKL